jgi:hypothetical protein
MRLGVFSWQTTKSAVKQGLTGSQDLIEIMMQTEDAKHGLKSSVKKMCRWKSSSWAEFVRTATASRKGSNIDVISAGSTTMDLLVSAMFFFFLLHSLAKLDRLATENLTTLDTEDDISIDGKLNQCVDKLFRLIFTITNSLLRRVPPGGVVVVKDKFFGQAIELGGFAFEIHRNEKHWKDPHTSKPGRFLGSAAEKKAAKKYWVPFSRGDRTCMGQSLAFAVTA